MRKVHIKIVAPRFGGSLVALSLKRTREVYSLVAWPLVSNCDWQAAEPFECYFFNSGPIVVCSLTKVEQLQNTRPPYFTCVSVL